MPSGIKYNVNDYIGKTFNGLYIKEFVEIKFKMQMVRCIDTQGNEKVMALTKVLKPYVYKPKKPLPHFYVKHGLTGCRIYRIWQCMKRRCYDPKNGNYKYYGGKGIKICDEWKDDFISFYNWAMDNGYSDKLTIDRINGNGNYCPENCRWATMRLQSINRQKFSGKIKPNTSGYVGIFLKKDHRTKKNFNKWTPYVRINNKNIFLGYYNTQKEALEARNKYIIDNGLDYPIQEYIGEIGSVNKE